MLDVCLLGTGGMMPLPNRWLTSLISRVEGSEILIDCGEGTQIAVKESGWSFKPIDVICVTHYHADHVSGLPGLLLAMANADRTESLTMIGPKGLERVVKSLRVIVPELPFEIEYREISKEKESFQFDKYRINAFKVNHAVACYGYSIEVDRQGKFDLERAKALNIPVKNWGILQSGKDVIIDGKTYTPDMVMGAQRKGLKVVYSTDTRPTASMVEAAQGADLFICEGMYGDDEKIENALKHKHMTFREAAELASKAQPSEMWLTHYSPSLVRPWEYIDSITGIYQYVKAGKDGMSTELKFEED